MNKFVFALAYLLSLPALSEEEAGPARNRVGPDKAVTEASQDHGFKLSPKAIASMGLGSLKVGSGNVIAVPSSSLVKFQDFNAVYRKRADWYRMIEVEPSFSGRSALIPAKDFQPGDEIVTENVGLLRVVDLDLWGPEADACAD